MTVFLSCCSRQLWLLPKLYFHFFWEEHPEYFLRITSPLPLGLFTPPPRHPTPPPDLGMGKLSRCKQYILIPDQRDCFRSSHVTQASPSRKNPGIVFFFSWNNLERGVLFFTDLESSMKVWKFRQISSPQEEGL